MASRKSPVNEEKLLNNLFVALEYSESLIEFVDTITDDERLSLYEALKPHFKD